MRRIPFSQVLKNAKLDIRREYDRLYDLFFLKNIYEGMNCIITLRSLCDKHFQEIPFSGTCVSLSDFDDSYKFIFREFPRDFDLDYLIRFCEYSYNLVCHVDLISRGDQTIAMQVAIQFYLRQIEKVVEKIGYMANKQDIFTDFVPKDQAAISVAEILIDPNLSYRVIEYNHHSMKGDLERKRATLLVLGDKLEPQLKKLKQINATLESNLSMLLNNVNVRHNNKESGKNYKKYVAEMKDEELEQWYDDLYQIILLAFLELDHLDRKGRLELLNENLKKN